MADNKPIRFIMQTIIVLNPSITIYIPIGTLSTGSQPPTLYTDIFSPVVKRE